MLLQTLSGETRDLFLVLDGIQFFICIEIAFLFFLNTSKFKSSYKTDIGWGIVFLCIGLTELMNIYRIYYLPEELWLENIKINSLIGIIPGLIVVGVLEWYYQQYKNTKFFFTTVASAVGVITYFTNELLTSILANISLSFLAIFIIMFLKDLIKNSSGVVRRNIVYFALSFLIFFVGAVIVSPRVITNQERIGIDVLFTGLLGRIVQMICLTIMALILFKLPIFFELEWRSKLVQIYIVEKKSGRPIFHHVFQEIKFKDPSEDQGHTLSHALVAGGIKGISLMLKEISQSSEELKTIDHGDQEILLDWGEFVFIALNVIEDMRIYREKIKKLRIEFEHFFEAILKDWAGDTAYFSPVVKMVEKEFM